jgi:hypothetical protein
MESFLGFGVCLQSEKQAFALLNAGTVAQVIKLGWVPSISRATNSDSLNKFLQFFSNAKT